MCRTGILKEFHNTRMTRARSQTSPSAITPQKFPHQRAVDVVSLDHADVSVRVDGA